MVVLCGPMDTSYGIPHSMGVNHFSLRGSASPQKPEVLPLARGSKSVKAFVVQCPQCQWEAVDVASSARPDSTSRSIPGAA